ncbi:hypothetical protein BC936DRAFT_141693 [Jimgerdemannia flammicorona]|uniref:Uncharacterized protein n=1 Tax=Jimgerdemannia flammicorona TaxID=994334 RepID=A0A433A1S9_9FUNG|nr:hypothetical protein BC936DRAFT_141693 [Jimgerdemannia flammicorona]
MHLERTLGCFPSTSDSIIYINERGQGHFTPFHPFHDARMRGARKPSNSRRNVARVDDAGSVSPLLADGMTY